MILNVCLHTVESKGNLIRKCHNCRDTMNIQQAGLQLVFKTPYKVFHHNSCALPRSESSRKLGYFIFKLWVQADCCQGARLSAHSLKALLCSHTFNDNSQLEHALNLPRVRNQNALSLSHTHTLCNSTVQLSPNCAFAKKQLITKTYHSNIPSNTHRRTCFCWAEVWETKNSGILAL